MNAGDAFLIPDGISTHISFVMAVLADGSLVISHFTTRRPRSDATCVVQAGEHPLIDRETAIRYDQTYICAADRIVNLKGVITKQVDALSGELLARIKKGALGRVIN